MTAYVIRRLLHASLVVLLVSILVFVVMRLLPGDPILMFVTSGDMQTASADQIAALKHTYGLDKPLPLQYIDWLSRAVQGDLGQSILFHYSVTEEIARRLPVSLELGLMALLVGITAPSFWVGILLIYVFGLKLGVLPAYGYTSPMDDFWTSMQQSVLPVVVLAVFPIAAAARQTRSSVLEVMQQDYVRTARAKGLSEQTTVTRHVLKNALMPVATLQGEIFRNIVAGSIVVETVFVIPGMSRLLLNGMLAQDYPVVQGVILVVAIAVVLANLIVDIAYGWLDPRIQYT